MKVYDACPEKGTARAAWAYFTLNWPGRAIREMYYSPCCDGIRAWVCHYEKTETDLLHWQGDFSCNYNIATVSCQRLSLWKNGETYKRWSLTPTQNKEEEKDGQCP